MYDDLINAANQVLNAEGLGGYPAGSFTKKIIQAFQRADSINFEKLTSIYPSIGMCAAALRRGDVELVRAWATGSRL